mmetsp:Transcript_41470/g.102306  ORF Transcript_41470/g.102306 Transcript_41470/m.102306 type:complete len:294 (+) Transcript_41470:2129-3010(+)
MRVRVELGTHSLSSSSLRSYTLASHTWWPRCALWSNARLLSTLRPKGSSTRVSQRSQNLPQSARPLVAAARVSTAGEVAESRVCSAAAFMTRCMAATSAATRTAEAPGTSCPPHSSSSSSSSRPAASRPHSCSRSRQQAASRWRPCSTPRACTPRRPAARCCRGLHCHPPTILRTRVRITTPSCARRFRNFSMAAASDGAPRRLTTSPPEGAGSRTQKQRRRRGRRRRQGAPTKPLRRMRTRSGAATTPHTTPLPASCTLPRWTPGPTATTPTRTTGTAWGGKRACGRRALKS